MTVVGNQPSVLKVWRRRFLRGHPFWSVRAARGWHGTHEGIGVRVEAWRSTEYRIGRRATQSNETHIEVSTPRILSPAGRIRSADAFDEDETTPGDDDSRPR